MRRMAVYVSKLQIPAMCLKLSCRNCPILSFQRVTYVDHTIKSTYINVLKIEAFDGMVKLFDQPSFAKNTIF